MRDRGISLQGLRLLKTFVDVLESDPNAELFGIEIIRRTGLSSGTVYPLLVRFESDGLLLSRWEVEQPETLNRPRRRLYRMTALGDSVVRAALRGLTSSAPYAIATSPARA